MKTSIETINGELCTVVWRINEPDVSGFMQWATSQDQAQHWGKDQFTGCRYFFMEELALIALPALPKHPKPEHAWLLYRYMAEGLTPHSTPAWKHGWDLDGVALIQALSCRALQVITHCEDIDGHRVDVAIEGDE